MTYSYLLYIGVFGAAVITYLWLRDARIFYRTAFPGYRKAAYYGVFYTALGLTGLLFVFRGYELVGLGMILLALYLQGNIQKEKDHLWSKDSTTLDRILGNVRIQTKK
ncbi:ABC transporter permease [Methanoplanus sp. FWC-SCC4]|uniref:ABC transporter permease n=1 Tax=Methanochimaera problematica TaxID=2609417 RepID=A0AA97I313_9EURY|nr:ABC transporter permease [Methanoplanus sp. FWC-SCC4]WOF15401.1 ABC transporter permease [Methanoplanus sp. FWC-SCC4]